MINISRLSGPESRLFVNKLETIHKGEKKLEKVLVENNQMWYSINTPNHR